MKKDKVNIKVVLDSRRTNNDERFPLKLRVTFKGTRKYYGTGYYASIEEWNIINSIDAKGKLRKIKNGIAAIENNAIECCDGITPYSFKL